MIIGMDPQAKYSFKKKSKKKSHIIRSRNYRIYLIDLFVGIPLKVIIRTIIFSLTSLIPKTMCSASISKLISYILSETSFNSLPFEHAPLTLNSNFQEKKCQSTTLPRSIWYSLWICLLKFHCIDLKNIQSRRTVNSCFAHFPAPHT